MQNLSATYKEAFTLFDTDGDGFITTKELGTVMRALGKSPTEAEIKAIISDVDPDGRGFIDFNEFEKIMARDIRSYNNEQELNAAWKVFDKQGHGFIPTSELRHILSNIGEKLSPAEVNDLVAEADPENKGQITYESFMKAMLVR
uniref:EF-hand domain-containing protein n=1 Tax=Polytomella parva TaxID=51329 RepID=A0A7S0YEH7_9CHLO|mmetsp:Transcript_21939/g.39117  ORF Transcript_21939/g.39117 Transcript_21939/m.39117 type:complete len:145 (+) Transcript_21939:238-672(+)|eukprot:CAMPEP_0175051250 /NCGR_PEP_ID=MMETSP0052_2-20121109/7689_1 /TAXON_ID=51329 ORGANISM="Polytomella parva, Strain SAG 63-3" /NCGR_SAMPLE_ID=MMETSP0052_2 /ASSEMBLY_ACC=CAM_ASM_000194 /LENGTH=144 /DNA_ID=CAMNT_0016315501 /DNA_START=187 /DNA_END=621 /DNA_ORIENTATION=-